MDVLKNQMIFIRFLTKTALPVLLSIIFFGCVGEKKIDRIESFRQTYCNTDRDSVKEIKLDSINSKLIYYYPDGKMHCERLYSNDPDIWNEKQTCYSENGEIIFEFSSQKKKNKEKAKCKEVCYLPSGKILVWRYKLKDEWR